MHTTSSLVLTLCCLGVKRTEDAAGNEGVEKLVSIAAVVEDVAELHQVGLDLCTWLKQKQKQCKAKAMQRKNSKEAHETNKPKRTR